MQKVYSLIITVRGPFQVDMSKSSIDTHFETERYAWFTRLENIQFGNATQMYVVAIAIDGLLLCLFVN